MNNNIQHNSNPRNKRLFAGLFLLGIGAAYLLHDFNIIYFPGWLFTWPVLLILIGLLTGIKHNFTKPGAYILLFIGGASLFNLITGVQIAYLFWPVILIVLGLRLILFKESKWCRDRWEMRKQWRHKMQQHHSHNTL